MKPTLKPGLAHRFEFTLPETKTVPHLYPESAMFQEMPHVLATGYMVGLMEWACIEALKPHLDWPREQSLGTQVNFSHLAATPPGLTVTVDVRLERVEGRKLCFKLSAHDGVDLISEGTHERHVIDVERFNRKDRGQSATDHVIAGTVRNGFWLSPERRVRQYRLLRLPVMLAHASIHFQSTPHAERR